MEDRAVRRPALALIIAAVLGSAMPAAAAAPSLQRVVLKPSQVGSGYRAKLLKDGNVVDGQVTLDLCGLRFPSEQLRRERLQMDYLHSGGVPEVSNEVVRYRPLGAQQALSEVKRAVARCPRGPVSDPVRRALLTYRLTRVEDRRLLPPHVALLAHVFGSVGRQRFDRRVVIVYQVRGAVLSAIYTDGTGSVRSQLRLGLHAAEQSANNLRRLIR